MRRSVARVAARALAGARQPFSAAATVPKSESAAAAEWARLAREGVRVNPCNSNHHPAALAGVAKPQAGNVQVSVQAAYDPLGMCFACGPAHPTGLRMASYRTSDGLQSEISVPDSFQARAHSRAKAVAVAASSHVLAQELPGMVSPGILVTLMSCHANWASSLALMDKAILPRPPLMVATQLSVDFSQTEFAPPDVPLKLSSRVTHTQDSQEPYTVDISVQLRADAPDEADATLYASGRLTFVKIGAVRSLNS